MSFKRKRVHESLCVYLSQVHNLKHYKGHLRTTNVTADLWFCCKLPRRSYFIKFVRFQASNLVSYVKKSSALYVGHPKSSDNGRMSKKNRFKLPSACGFGFCIFMFEICFLIIT